jgi:hypothetical protein
MNKLLGVALSGLLRCSERRSMQTAPSRQQLFYFFLILFQKTHSHLHPISPKALVAEQFLAKRYVFNGAAAGFQVSPTALPRASRTFLEERFLKISKDFYSRGQHVFYTTSRLTHHYLT